MPGACRTCGGRAKLRGKFRVGLKANPSPSVRALVAEPPHPPGAQSTRLDPTTPTTRNPAISRPPKARKMDPHHQANSSRLLMAILLFSVILLAEFVSDLKLPGEDASPPPLAAIVAVSLTHLDRSLDLGRNLLELSSTFGFADYRRENDLIALEEEIKPYDRNVSDSLYATHQTLLEVRPYMRYPLSFVAADMGGTLARIRSLVGQVRRFHMDPEASCRDPWARISLKGQVTRIFSRVIPSDLTALGTFLELSSEHCEILEHMGATAVPVLPTLLKTVGRVRPRFVISAWMRDQNPSMQERNRLHESVESLFKEINAHCKVLSRVERSFRDYWELRSIFATYGYISQLPLIDTPSVDRLLDQISDPLEKLEELVTIAGEERRRILKSSEPTDTAVSPQASDNLDTNEM